MRRALGPGAAYGAAVLVAVGTGTAGVFLASSLTGTGGREPSTLGTALALAGAALLLATLARAYWPRRRERQRLPVEPEESSGRPAGEAEPHRERPS